MNNRRFGKCYGMRRLTHTLTNCKKWTFFISCPLNSHTLSITFSIFNLPTSLSTSFHYHYSSSMADVTKYQLLPTDIKAHFSLFKTRKSSTIFVYGVVLVFVAFTLFLAFSPSSYSSSPWLVSLFTLNSTSPPTIFHHQSNGSHFSSVFSHFFPNSSQLNPTQFDNITFSQLPTSQNSTKPQFPPDKGKEIEPNCKNQTCSGKNESVHSEVYPPKIQESPPRSQNLNPTQVPTSKNTTKTTNLPNKGTNLDKTQRNQSIATPPNSHDSTKSQVSRERGGNLKQDCKNGSCDGETEKKSSSNIPQITQSHQNSTYGLGNSTKVENETKEKVVKEKGAAPDFGASFSTKQSNPEGSGKSSGEKSNKQGNNKESLVSSLVGCDLYDGGWVRDESYPLYKPGSCSLIDEQFNCIRNGRPDHDFHKLKWKPKGCTLPRLRGDHMLKLLKGKRLVFVGDSLNRNMWESLVCVLRNFVKNKKRVYEAYGRHSFRTEASYSFVFRDHNFTVEFFVAPFIVQQWDFKDVKGETKETLRLDLMVRDNDQFKHADFLVFNTGHWWTHEKTSKGEDYYQEGSHVYKQLDVAEAFRRAITTWARWVDANINPDKTHVLFRGYSASHFSGGQWNSGGQCDNETEPIKNDEYLTPYPWKMKVLESVFKGMKTPVSYLNITRMTDYRKDGHPSIYRKMQVTSEAERQAPLKYQDCSHWCLPGVPDSWNELLYAELLRKQYIDQQHKKI